MPSTLRFLAHHNPTEFKRWTFVSIVTTDPVCRAWLASLENPTKTRRGFEIYTLAGDITSDWIKFHGQHEGSTERFILDQMKAGTTFLDIGSNIGYFSLLAASITKKNMSVVAFEPQRRIADLLAQSVEHNHFQERIRVEQLALSNAPSVMKMTSCPGNSGGSHLTDLADPGVERDTVSVVVLDDWLKQNSLPRVSVCKIDTEGAENDVLAGMSELLDRDGPALVVELMEDNLIRFNASVSLIRNRLKAHGYRDVSSSYVCSDDANGYFVKGRA